MDHFTNPNIYIMKNGDICLISVSNCKLWFILEGQYGIYDTSIVIYPYNDIVIDLGKLYKR